MDELDSSKNSSENNTFYVPSNELDFKHFLSKVLKFLEEEIQSFEKLFEELNGEFSPSNMTNEKQFHKKVSDRKSGADHAVATEIHSTLPLRPELKPKPILIKKGEKPKTLPKPKIPPKVAPKPNVHFRAQQSDGGTEV